ncbi:MAG: M50 family metallopeptidase [Paenisporosarcina sp.]
MPLSNSMNFRLHPILIPIIFFLIGTGQFAHYTIIFVSLMIHEMGHLIAAKWTGLSVKSCTIMPYGGEIIIRELRQAPKHQQWFIAIAGPLATALLILGSNFFTFSGQAFFNQVQLTILFLNCLPILPLDGGQALLALVPEWYEWLLLISIFLPILFILLISNQVHLQFLFAFIVYQNIKTWQYRKYEAVFQDIVQKRLTL